MVKPLFSVPTVPVVDAPEKVPPPFKVPKLKLPLVTVAPPNTVLMVVAVDAPLTVTPPDSELMFDVPPVIVDGTVPLEPETVENELFPPRISTLPVTAPVNPAEPLFTVTFPPAPALLTVPEAILNEPPKFDTEVNEPALTDIVPVYRPALLQVRFPLPFFVMLEAVFVPAV